MGAAGVATGVVTGEAVQQAIDEVEAVQSSAPVSGNVTIKDPVTGQPRTDFVTDENGELTIGYSAPPGQTAVEVTIGGETIVVDLDPVVSGPSPPYSQEIVFDYVNFTTPDTGFQSTATLSPQFGVTPTGPVTWSALSSTTSAPFWYRGPSGFQGLTWGPTADGQIPWLVDAVRGTAPTGVYAQLTDVVGNRTVVVRASTVVAGVTYSRDMTVTFGNGPLSAFSGLTTGNSSPPNISWAPTASSSAFASTPSSSFNAPNMCSGGGWSGNTTVTGSPASFGAGWTAEVIAPDTYHYSASSKLPTKEQLASISIYNPSSNSSSIPSKGAAQASGWVSLVFWTGSLMSDASGNMFALGVFTDTGNYASYPVNSATQAAVACIN
jgi:hypothetical protein